MNFRLKIFVHLTRSFTSFQEISKNEFSIENFCAFDTSPDFLMSFFDLFQTPPQLFSSSEWYSNKIVDEVFYFTTYGTVIESSFSDLPSSDSSFSDQFAFVIFIGGFIYEHCFEDIWSKNRWFLISDTSSKLPLVSRILPTLRSRPLRTRSGWTLFQDALFVSGRTLFQDPHLVFCFLALDGFVECNSLLFLQHMGNFCWQKNVFHINKLF